MHCWFDDWKKIVKKVIWQSGASSVKRHLLEPWYFMTKRLIITGEALTAVHTFGSKVTSILQIVIQQKLYIY